MVSGKWTSLSGAILAAVSAVLSMWSAGGVMLVFSFLTLFLCIAASRRCTDKVCHFSLIVSVIVLAVTIMISSCVSYQFLVEELGMSIDTWIDLTCALYVIAVLPLTLLTLPVISAVFGSAFNWALISGLFVLNSIGILSLGYAVFFLQNGMTVDTDIMSNNYIVNGLGLTLIFSLLLSIVIGYIIRRNGSLLTSRGLVKEESIESAVIKKGSLLANIRSRGRTISSEEDAKERLVAWATLIVCPLTMFALYALVALELVPGLEAGHPVEYLKATCLQWGVIMMVLPILRLLRIIALPTWVNIVVYANLYLYVISLCGGLFLNLYWWGDFSHLVSSIIVAAFVLVALCMVETYSPPQVTLGSKGGFLIMIFLLSMCFGGTWEIIEGFVDYVTGTDYMIYGADDTLSDLVADLTGVVIMMIAAFAILKKQNAETIASRIRIGRNAFKVSDSSGSDKMNCE